jgi:hypothetical protein
MSRLVAILILATAGAILFGQGLYIHAKAMLAQVLLQRAFAESLATGGAVKPWPWADTWPEARIAVKRIAGRPARTGERYSLPITLRKSLLLLTFCRYLSRQSATPADAEQCYPPVTPGRPEAPIQ